MSKTFTSRPAVTQARGRGARANTQTMANSRTQNTAGVAGAQPKMYRATPLGMGRGAGRGITGRGGYGTGSYNTRSAGMDYDDVTEEQPQAQSSQEQRMTYEGSYTKITPNEKRRQKIQQMAQAEEQSYNSYKQQNTPTTVNYVGTAGGGEMREADVRRKSQQEISKVQRLERKKQLEANKKSAEQAEIDKRKAEQRKKAELNEQRKKEEEENATHKWDDQRKRTNEAFLRRLENKSKKPPPSMAQNFSGEASASLAKPRDTSTSSSMASSRLIPNSNSTERIASSPGATGVTNEFEKKVIALQAIFPQYDTSELGQILEQLNGSLDEAVAVLQDY